MAGKIHTCKKHGLTFGSCLKCLVERHEGAPRFRYPRKTLPKVLAPYKTGQELYDEMVAATSTDKE